MFESPFQSQNLDQLQYQYQTQLDALNKIKSANEVNILNEINRELMSLGKEELNSLYETNEYKGAKSIYEAGFLQFISNKFSQEYIQTPEGKEAGQNLLKTIKDSKEKIAYLAKIKSEKIEKMLELLDSDPEIRKRYTELTENQQKKSKK